MAFGQRRFGRSTATTATVVTTALAAAVGMVATAAPAGAATANVGCSPAALVAAVNTANGAAGADTIVLAAQCTYTFTAPDNHWYGPNALPPIASAITIEGNGAIIERASSAPKFRLFYVGADPATPARRTGRRPAPATSPSATSPCGAAWPAVATLGRAAAGAPAWVAPSSTRGS
jgi:hypothetical protein